MPGIDEYTKLLLHMDGDASSEIGGNDSSTRILCHFDASPFLDHSHEVYSISNTNATVSSSVKKFGGGSGYFDQTAYLDFGNQSGLDLTTQDFTIDCWVKIPTSGLGSNYLIICSKGSTSGYGYFLGVSPTNGHIRWWSRNSGSWQDKGTSGIDIRDDTWHHVAVVKTGTSLKIYVDGASYLDTTLAGATIDGSSSYPFYIGRTSPGWYFKGYIDEFRFSRSVQRWTTSFTPPTEQYGGHNFYPQGNPELDTSQKKFGSSSMYFTEAQSEYLICQLHNDWDFGTGDFTIDCWVNYDSTSYGLLGMRTDAAGSYAFRRNASNYLVWRASGSDIITSSGTISNSDWTHVAVVRNSGETALFIDGVRNSAWTTDTTDYAASNLLGIGAGYSTSHYMDGNIDEFRISKGVARWTDNFSVPTEAYSTDSYTKLLLHFNGDMSDSAHGLEFNGSIYVPVSPTKWNGTFYFDGSGDYVDIDDHDDWEFGSGDFTIDVWVRFASSSSSDNMIVSHWDGDAGSNRGWRFYHGMDSNLLTFSYSLDGSSGNNKTWSWSPNKNQWYHLAVVRNGSNLYAFVDGTEIGTTQSITGTIHSVSTPLVIGARYDFGNPGLYFDGFMDELRISNTARWTSNFTPSIEPYSPYYVSGNMNFDGRIIALRETDWSVVYNQEHTGGSYIASGLGSGNVTVIFRKSDGDSQGYGNVTPN